MTSFQETRGYMTRPSWLSHWTITKQVLLDDFTHKITKIENFNLKIAHIEVSQENIELSQDNIQQ